MKTQDPSIGDPLTPERIEALDIYNQALVKLVTPMINEVGRAYSNIIIAEAEKDPSVFQDYREPVNATFNAGVSIGAQFIAAAAGMIGPTRGHDVIIANQLWMEIEPQLKKAFMENFTRPVSDPEMAATIKDIQKV